MRRRTKGLATLLAMASLTTGAYYGVGHGVTTYYAKAYGPQVLLESCTRVEKLPDGTIHREDTMLRHQYATPEIPITNKWAYKTPKEDDKWIGQEEDTEKK